MLHLTNIYRITVITFNFVYYEMGVFWFPGLFTILKKTSQRVGDFVIKASIIYTKKIRNIDLKIVVI